MTVAAPRPRHRKKDTYQQQIDELYRIVGVLIRQIDAMRNRMHMAAGTDPKSPRYSPARNKGFWASFRWETKRIARRKAMRKSGLSGHAYRVRRFRQVREQRGLGAAVAMAVIRYPLQYLKTFIIACIAAALVIFIIFYWAVRPVLSAILPPIPSPGSDLMNPYDVPGFIVPGSMTNGACVTPAAGPTDRPKGGLEGTAYAVGDKAADLIESNPTAEEIHGGLMGFVHDLGFALEIMKKAAKREMPEPREAVGGVAPSSASAGATVVPASAPGAPGALSAIKQAGFPESEWRQALMVAGAESEYRADVDGPTVGAYDHDGLFQIQSSHISNPQINPSGVDNRKDPVENAKMAYRLWEAAGRDWSGPWAASQSRWSQYAAQADAALASPSPTTTTPIASCAPTGPGVAESGPESELSVNAALGRRQVRAAFPELTIGGWGERPNATEHDDVDHTGRKASRALDIMNSTDAAGMARGYEVNRWLLANWETLKIQYVIFDHKIWRSPTEVPRDYHGRSSHEDHNHATFLPDSPEGVQQA
jgi:hypothetical protein